MKYGMKLEKTEMKEKAEKSKEDLEKLEISQKEFAEDIERCEADYNAILNSKGIDDSIRLEMLRELRARIDSVKESYYNNVTELFMQKKEEYEESVTQMLEKAREYEQLQRHFSKQSYSSMEKAGLGSTADKIKESATREGNDYRETAKKNSEDLALKMQQYENLNRQIMKNRFSGN